MTLEISCLSRSFSVLNASHSSPRKLFFFVAVVKGLRFEGTLDAICRDDGLLGVNGALVVLVGRNGLRGLDLALSSKLCLGLGVEFSWSNSFVGGLLPVEVN